MSLHNNRRKCSESSSTEEEPDFMSEDYHKIARPTSSTSTNVAENGRLTKNANLWKDVAMEQSLNEQMSRSGRILGNEHGFDRGTESYTMPKGVVFDDIPEELPNSSIDNKKKKNPPKPEEDEDIFSASNQGPIAEFGVKGTFRVLKKKATSGRFAQRQNSRRNSNQSEKDSGVFSFNNRKRRFTGSRESLASSQSQNHDRQMKRFKEIPKDFLAPEYSLQALLNSHIPKHLDGEELGRYIANVMGDQNPEAIVKAVQLAGKEMCITLFNETKRIEEEGGMLICNKTRRRTPGGVFLTLFRQNRSISDEAKNELMEFSRALMKAKEQNKLEQKMEEKATIAMEEMQVLPTASEVFNINTSQS